MLYFWNPDDSLIPNDDDRYLTLVILFTPVTLVSLFRSYIPAHPCLISTWFLFLFLTCPHKKYPCKLLSSLLFWSVSHELNQYRFILLHSISFLYFSLSPPSGQALVEGLHWPHNQACCILPTYFVKPSTQSPTPSKFCQHWREKYLQNMIINEDSSTASVKYG